MTDRATLENELRDALIAALGISYPFERLVEDLAISRQDIVDAVRFNRAVQQDATQLIRVCWEFDNGLASLQEVALAALKGRRGLQRLSKAFQECLAAQVEESGQDSLSPLTSRNRYQAKDLPAWRNSLGALATRYPDVDDVLHDALDRALREKLGEGDIHSRCSFLSSGRIKGWSDLLARNESSNDCLDPALIDALEGQLKSPPPAPSSASRVGSLVVMLLDLRNGNYGYRAYVCLDAHPEDRDWKRMTELPQEEIKAKDWKAQLEARLPVAIGCAHALLPRAAELLLEIFLPKTLLHEDVGSLDLPISEYSNDSELLRFLHPYVLRSSERFQMFQESNCCSLPHTLPRRWQTLLSSKSQPLWIHDQTCAGRVSSEVTKREAREGLKKLFRNIQVQDAYFGVKRIADMPTDPELRLYWHSQVINACPAVALWWRPGSSSTKEERESFFKFQGECGEPPFGASAPPTEPNDQESFFHRSGPLELFHTLARTVLVGLTQPDQTEVTKVCRELVLLVDAADRWPPSLEKGPAPDPAQQPEGSDAVLTIQADEILHC